MLEHFMRRYEIDIAMLQEVTSKQHIEMKGYHVIDNIGTAGLGKAIVMREYLKMDRIKRIPSGRRLTAYCKKRYVSLTF